MSATGQKKKFRSPVERSDLAGDFRLLARVQEDGTRLVLQQEKGEARFDDTIQMAHTSMRGGEHGTASAPESV